MTDELAPKKEAQNQPGVTLDVRQKDALGQLAARDLHPEIHQNTQWVPPQNGLQKELAGVHLGKQVRPDGWNAGFKDRSETPVYDAGLVFVASQASHGPTSIDAKALHGFKIEAAELDATTGNIEWVKPHDEEGEVRVVSDRGNLMETPFDEWSTTNLGSPGTRAGVVRVTGPENDTKYFALGAAFQGEPDNWQVLGGIIEVQPHETQTLSGQSLELPPAE